MKRDCPWLSYFAPLALLVPIQYLQSIQNLDFCDNAFQVVTTKSGLQIAAVLSIMRSKSAGLILVLLCCAIATNVKAQTTTSDRLESLRAQLDDSKSRQLAFQDRLRELDEQLKPENIESSLAGVGSTKPEELREQRRKQLERQKTTIQNQLNLLVEGQNRLETAIAQAEGDAYHESAAVNTVDTPGPTSAVSDSAAKQTRERRVNKSKLKSKRSSRSTQN